MVVASEQHDEHQYDEGEGDDAGDLDPAWGASDRAAISAPIALGKGGLVSHGWVLDRGRLERSPR
jgi:hypothetical protein